MRKILACSVVLCMTSGPAVFAAENWVGTWKLNAAKSKSTNAISAQTIKFEKTPAGIMLTSEGIDAQGNPMKSGYTSKFDGKDVPWSGNPVADSAAPKRIDDNNYENVWKKNGKATVTAKITVSADGKTMTVTQAGTDAEGKAVSAVAVYDRQ
jgi:hypothetical protein